MIEQSAGERNYHALYQLVREASDVSFCAFFSLVVVVKRALRAGERDLNSLFFHHLSKEKPFTVGRGRVGARGVAAAFAAQGDGL